MQCRHGPFYVVHLGGDAIPLVPVPYRTGHTQSLLTHRRSVQDVRLTVDTGAGPSTEKR